MDNWREQLFSMSSSVKNWSLILAVISFASLSQSFAWLIRFYACLSRALLTEPTALKRAYAVSIIFDNQREIKMAYWQLWHSLSLRLSALCWCFSIWKDAVTYQLCCLGHRCVSELTYRFNFNRLSLPYLIYTEELELWRKCLWWLFLLIYYFRFFNNFFFLSKNWFFNARGDFCYLFRNIKIAVVTLALLMKKKEKRPNNRAVTIDTIRNRPFTYPLAFQMHQLEHLLTIKTVHALVNVK